MSDSTTGPQARVLVADDDPRTRDVLRRYLTRAGHLVLQAGDGVDALDQHRHGQPDLVILDLMMPGMDGLAVCAEIRKSSDVPVMLLTALGSESDRVVGLEQGADDYVVKPFSPREVTLRVARLLSRSMPGDQPGQAAREAVRDGRLVLDPLARSVELDGTPLELTLREFDLLAFLITHPQQAFSRSELLRRVWQWDFGDDSTVTVHVRRLREKIESDPGEPEHLITVRGVGYRWHRAHDDPGRRSS